MKGDQIAKDVHDELEMSDTFSETTDSFAANTNVSTNIILIN